MVTIRTYANPMEAALARSLLDDHEIVSVLLHENANTFYPLAVPARLMVPDDQARRAIQILNEHSDPGEENAGEITEEPCDVAGETLATEDRANRNPWELLMLAFYLLLPSLCLLITKFPTASFSSRIRYFIVRAHVTQLLSLILAVLAMLLIVTYFRIRHSLKVAPAANHNSA